MVQDFLQLRDNLHAGEVRFNLTPELWEVSYLKKPGVRKDDIIEVKENGRLSGYAVCSLTNFAEDIKSYQVLEFNAASKTAMLRLLEQITEHAIEKGADLIVLSEFQEQYDSLLAQDKFVDFTSYAVLAAILDPAGLLRTLATDGKEGRRLNLVVVGHNPVSLVIGRNTFSMADNKSQPDITVTMNDKVFCNILFGKTTVAREFIRGTIHIDSIIQLGTIMRFFAIIRQNKLYIPPGDGI